MDDGPAGDAHIEILARLAGHVAAGAALPALRAKFPGYPKVDQRVQRVIGDQVNASAITAIAAIRTAFFDILFTPKTQATMAAIPSLHTNCGFIDEFHNRFRIRKTPHMRGVLKALTIESPPCGR